MLERALGTLGRIDDKLAEIQARLFAPVLKLRGIDTVITKTREERIKFLTEFFRRANENGGIKEIRAALGVEDGDMDELAEALINVGIVLPPGVELSRIRIKEVPIGPAPEDVRRSWVGMELVAVKVPPESSGEINFVTREKFPPREAYAVLAQPAIQALGERSPQAATWFQQNLPSDIPALTFGANEVEIVATVFR
ncbi:hypothetical protein HY945_05000 [Candidatus Gottesmanbacteria bacterium]|nr:hypothetical protein [Candidatus Gottesmanbacteria bacterium]